jgi:hypothetical protein
MSRMWSWASTLIPRGRSFDPDTFPPPPEPLAGTRRAWSSTYSVGISRRSPAAKSMHRSCSSSRSHRSPHSFESSTHCSCRSQPRGCRILKPVHLTGPARTIRDAQRPACSAEHGSASMERTAQGRASAAARSRHCRRSRHQKITRSARSRLTNRPRETRQNLTLHFLKLDRRISRPAQRPLGLRTSDVPRHVHRLPEPQHHRDNARSVLAVWNMTRHDSPTDDRLGPHPSALGEFDEPDARVVGGELQNGDVR